MFRQGFFPEVHYAGQLHYSEQLNLITNSLQIKCIETEKPAVSPGRSVVVTAIWSVSSACPACAAVP